MYSRTANGLLGERGRCWDRSEAVRAVWEAAVDRAVDALRILSYMSEIGLDGRAAETFLDDLETNPDGLIAALGTAADWLPRNVSAVAVGSAAAFDLALADYRVRQAKADQDSPITFID